MGYGLEKISVVIPAKDEPSNIGFVVDWVKPYVDEILVVCDDPSDPTIPVAQTHGACVLVNTLGPGRGKAIRFGVDHASGDVIVFMDADGSHDADEVPKFVQLVRDGTADLVLGSRMRGSSDEFSNSLRERIHFWANKASALITNLICGSRISDVHYGLRAIRATIAKSLKLEEPRMMTELELVIKCFKRNVRVVELPTHEFRRRSGKTRIKFVSQFTDWFLCYLKYP